MKNLGIAFLAAMTIASFGCKKKGGDVIGKMTEFKDKMCKCNDKACVDKVEEEETKAMQEMAKANAGEAKKDEKPDDAMMKKMTDIGMAKMECKMKASGMGGGAMGGSAAPAGGSAAPAGSDSAAAGSGSAAPAAGSAAPVATGDADMSAWPQECKDYKAAVDNMMKCDKMGAARDGMKTGFESMTKAWSAIPAGAAMDAAMKGAATGCKAGSDAIATSMKAMGC